MSAAKTVTTTTRTFTSYSSTDSVRNPDRVLIQRAEVTYKVPGQGEVKDHYTIAADPNQVLETPSSQQSSKPVSNQYSPKVPQHAFSYTAGMNSTSSSSQRSQVSVISFLSMSIPKFYPSMYGIHIFEIIQFQSFQSWHFLPPSMK